MERNEPKPPSTKGLASHRKVLEEEGVESGREVQKKYRNEMIQMKKAMAELRSTEPKDEAPPENATWLERIGEKIGDFLAEPSDRPDPDRRPRGPAHLRGGICDRAFIAAHTGRGISVNQSSRRRPPAIIRVERGVSVRK